VDNFHTVSSILIGFTRTYGKYHLNFIFALKFPALSDNSKGNLLAVITAVLWGFLAIALKIAVLDFNPYNIVWFRFAIAFSVLFLYFGIRNPSRLHILKKPPPLLLLAAFFLALNYIGFMQGVNYTSPGNTQIFIQVGALSLALVGLFVYKEKLSIYQGIGFIMAALGFVLFYQQQLEMTPEKQSVYNQGNLWILGGAFSWTAFASIQKKLVRNASPQQLNLVIYGLPVILIAPLVDWAAFGNLSPGMLTLLVFLGANTLIAYGCLTAALKFTEANKVSIIITLNPIITFLALLILDWLEVKWLEPENISLTSFISALIVLSGAILVISGKNLGNGRKKRLRKSL
jgi:drug/metabolite transporter (DMT)-like permease